MRLRVLFRGGFIGGMVAFLWTAFSWSVLGWHQQTLQAFANESAVADLLRTEATAPGVYLLPNPHHSPAGLDPEQRRERLERQMEATRTGPVALVTVRPQGQDLRNPAWLTNTLGIHLLAATLLTLLAWPLRTRSFLSRWGHLLLIVFAGGVLCHLPNWNWWHFGPAWTLVSLADMLLGWGIAGLVISWAVGGGRRFVN